MTELTLNGAGRCWAMNNLIHLMNRTHTHIDVESGSFISLPKDGTDFPPVNADINNLITYGKTTGGEGTPAVPIPLVNVGEWNTTVCGENLFNPTNGTVTAYGLTVTATDGTIVINGTVTAGLYPWIKWTNGLALTAGTPALATTPTWINGKSIPDGNYSKLLTVVSGTTTSVSQFVLQTLNSSFEGTTIATNTAVTNATNLTGYLGGGGTVYNNYTIKIDLEKSVTAPTIHTDYTGNTYPYRLEDVNGVLHDNNSLPDGTRDSYDRDNNLFTQKVKVLTVSSGTGWWYYSVNDTFAALIYNDTNNAWGVATVTTNTLCNIAVPGNYVVSSGRYTLAKRTTDTIINLYVLKSELSSLDSAGAVAWINAQIAAKGNIVFMYELATPLTFQIKPYSAEFPYNEKPKSIQYHTNIFNDAGLEMQCEVRKLGNRAIGTFNWITESGDKIITENGDYILLEY